MTPQGGPCWLFHVLRFLPVAPQVGAERGGHQQTSETPWVSVVPGVAARCGVTVTLVCVASGIL